MRRILYVLAVVLAGCATKYQSAGLAGGFSETQLAPNVFRITFNGNGYTASERASDFALLRSAHLTLKGGYSYFVIVDERADTSTLVYTTPLQATTYGRTTTVTGGQAIPIRRPSSTNVIACFTNRPEGMGFVYDATFVANSLSAKYGVQLD